jgi:hypothetical protein
MLAIGGSAGPMLIGVPASAQTVREVFQKVAPSVVVVRVRGRDVTISGQEVPLGGDIILAVEGIPASAANPIGSARR